MKTIHFYQIMHSLQFCVQYNIYFGYKNVPGMMNKVATRVGSDLSTFVESIVADPDPFDTDPNPAFHFDTYPYPDPAFQFDSDHVSRSNRTQPEGIIC